MYICICKAVTEKEVLRQVKEKGVKTVRSLGRATGACQQCGKCATDASNLIKRCIQGATHREAQQAA